MARCLVVCRKTDIGAEALKDLFCQTSASPSRAFASCGGQQDARSDWVLVKHCFPTYFEGRGSQASAMSVTCCELATTLATRRHVPAPRGSAPWLDDFVAETSRSCVQERCG